MNANSLNLCPKCAYESFCVLTHNKSLVFSCSEFDESQYQAPKPIVKIKKSEPELVTI